MIGLSCPSHMGTAVRMRIGARRLRGDPPELEDFWAATFIGSPQFKLAHSVLASNGQWLYAFGMGEKLNFSGKTILVTGSSRGIGAGIVTAFGKHGARCAINYVADDSGRNQKNAETVAATLPDAMLV